jgi:DNA (cytosine-5)-methyltransferase 1
MNTPKLLDLCSKAGGAAEGYRRAGWNVTCVDIEPQPRNPFTFIQADALHFLAEFWGDFDAVHISPPCQRFSGMSACRPGLADEYPDLIAASRGLLELTGLPYVIENVVGSPLRPDLMLCGAMFGRQTYRHRIFESNAFLWQPEHPRHAIRASKAGHWQPGTFISVSGNCSPIALAREVMDIDWMTRRELGESIPPYFTEHIGRQLLDHVARAAA